MTGTLGTYSDDVLVKALADLLLVDLTSLLVIHAQVAPFVFDIPSNPPLCGGSERVLLLSDVTV